MTSSLLQRLEQAEGATGGDELTTLMGCELRYDVRAGWFDINHPKKGWSHIADMRGWGFLTGRGSGALALESSEGKMIQDAIAAEIVKLWNARLLKAVEAQDAN